MCRWLGLQFGDEIWATIWDASENGSETDSRASIISADPIIAPRGNLAGPFIPIAEKRDSALMGVLPVIDLFEFTES